MAHPVDRFVSSKIRACRVSRGLTQANLAKEIGCSFQQLQKYESGNNRVSASRLYDIAHALRVPVAYFFEGYSSENGSSASNEMDPMTSRILFALAHLESDEVKEKLCKMIVAIAGAEARGPESNAA